MICCRTEDGRGTGVDQVKSAPKPQDRERIQKGNNPMEFQTKVLLTRYGPPPAGPAEPSLTIFHTQAAWDRFVKESDGARDSLAKITVDWSASVLLLIQTIAEGGMDRFPSIVSLSRQGNATEIRIEMVRNPEGQMLDVVVQPWLIAEAPAQAFTGNPKILVSVKEQPGGKVAHQY